MSELEALIAGIPYLRHLGVELLELGDCRARMALTLQPWMLNSWGVAQGGVTMAVIDACMSFAGRSLQGGGVIGVTIEMKTNFLAPARGRLLFTARAVRQGESLFCADCDVAGADGVLVARSLGTFKLRSRPRPLADETGR